MTIQLSTTVRNAQLDVVESTISTTPTLEIRSGAAPATCATADSGTVLATMTLPSDWMAAASSGSKALAGTWEDTSADASGTIGHFRLKQSTTCHMQGSAGVAVAIATNGTTAAGAAVLNFASTTGVSVGMAISGTGVPTGAEVVAVTATTVTMSDDSSAGVSSALTITFSPDLVMDAATTTAGQRVAVTAFTLSAAGA